MSRRRPILRDFARKSITNECTSINELVDANNWLAAFVRVSALVRSVERLRGPARLEARALIAETYERFHSGVGHLLFDEGGTK